MSGTSPFVEFEEIGHLNVPPIAVPNTANEYILSSLWSVIRYFANFYPDSGVQRGTIEASMEDLSVLFSNDEGGWRPKQEPLSQLSRMVESLAFRLDEWVGNPPRPLIELAREEIEDHCPLIALVDTFAIRDQVEESGPIHSIVIAGVTDSECVVLDPLEGKKVAVDNPTLERGWDPEMHQIIRCRPRRGWDNE